VLQVSENAVKMAYGYSKMTVKDEQKCNDNYNKLVFVEFLEFIARICWLSQIQVNKDGWNDFAPGA